MNKQEKIIIFSHYKQVYYNHLILDYDKADTIRELRSLLKSLNLEKERYQVENEVIIEQKGYNSITKEAYQMIFDTFFKHDVLIHYDLAEINFYYDELRFQFTPEEIKCHAARINLINS